MKFPWRFFFRSNRCVCRFLSVPHCQEIAVLTFVRLRFNYFAFNHVNCTGNFVRMSNINFILAYIHKQCFFSALLLLSQTLCVCKCLYVNWVSSSMQVYDVRVRVCVCVLACILLVFRNSRVSFACVVLCCLFDLFMYVARSATCVCVCVCMGACVLCLCIQSVPTPRKFSYFKYPAQYYEIVPLRKNVRNVTSPLTTETTDSADISMFDLSEFISCQKWFLSFFKISPRNF